MNTIPILDHERAVDQGLCDFFADRQWGPVLAESGEGALSLREKEQPLTAIMDVRLPPMDGSDSIREVCRRHLGTALVTCSGWREDIVPPALQEFGCVSKRLFKKSVTDLAEMEKEVLRVMEGIFTGVDDE